MEKTKVPKRQPLNSQSLALKMQKKFRPLDEDINNGIKVQKMKVSTKNEFKI